MTDRVVPLIMTDEAACSSRDASFLRGREVLTSVAARYIFEPIAVKTFGVFNASARHFLNDLGSWKLGTKDFSELGRG